MARLIDMWQNSVHRVADEYRFSSDVPSMFRFDITTEMKIKFKNPKNGGLPKISVKRGYLVISPLPPLPPVASCHHMSSFGRPPPSPSSDDVIYKQPRTGQIVFLGYIQCGSMRLFSLLLSVAAFWNPSMEPILGRQLPRDFLQQFLQVKLPSIREKIIFDGFSKIILEN